MTLTLVTHTGKGRIHLSQSDYEELSRSQIKASHPETRSMNPDATTRIITNCLAKDQSLQILGPVGVDIWKDVAFIKTEGLVSRDKAIQVGYAITMEVFDKIVSARQV